MANTVGAPSLMELTLDQRDRTSSSFPRAVAITEISSEEGPPPPVDPSQGGWEVHPLGVEFPG